jgi:hypothetical protein
LCLPLYVTIVFLLRTNHSNENLIDNSPAAPTIQQTQ